MKLVVDSTYLLNNFVSLLQIKRLANAIPVSSVIIQTSITILITFRCPARNKNLIQHRNKIAGDNCKLAVFVLAFNISKNYISEPVEFIIQLNIKQKVKMS